MTGIALEHDAWLLVGDGQKALHGSVAERIVAEIPKDFTNNPTDRIAQLLVNPDR
jgi:protein required for attachment to host cells